VPTAAVFSVLSSDRKQYFSYRVFIISQNFIFFFGSDGALRTASAQDRHDAALHTTQCYCIPFSDFLRICRHTRNVMLETATHLKTRYRVSHLTLVQNGELCDFIDRSKLAAWQLRVLTIGKTCRANFVKLSSF